MCVLMPTTPPKSVIIQIHLLERDLGDSLFTTFKDVTIMRLLLILGDGHERRCMT